jgi:hypothetical protein
MRLSSSKSCFDEPQSAVPLSSAMPRRSVGQFWLWYQRQGLESMIFRASAAGRRACRASQFGGADDLHLVWVDYIQIARQRRPAVCCSPR